MDHGINQLLRVIEKKKSEANLAKFSPKEFLKMREIKLVLLVKQYIPN